MKFITWLMFVLPAVSMVWLWDIISLGILLIYHICSRRVKQLFRNYYIYLFKRSEYMRDRTLMSSDQVTRDYYDMKMSHVASTHGKPAREWMDN